MRALPSGHLVTFEQLPLENSYRSTTSAFKPTSFQFHCSAFPKIKREEKRNGAVLRIGAEQQDILHIVLLRLEIAEQ